MTLDSILDGSLVVIPDEGDQLLGLLLRQRARPEVGPSHAPVFLPSDNFVEGWPGCAFVLHQALPTFPVVATGAEVSIPRTAYPDSERMGGPFARVSPGWSSRGGADREVDRFDPGV